ncbi:3-deoxy-D-arabino-heptulosonate 7-phosphate synthase [Cupriavidus respiraculi]|uniref:3-deoxy-D-arabino-heptulosonate 7-phosphate synthase n=1 Tax=Cupriavidus respiraculi TaxID=195930 RepID=UPI001C9842EB|nr:3-deoxy-D-arabino-heptulosonate 7-phosphate synthase [Cupriavidus respiraculi]MBY4947629.1 3-deoxy-D-arabino-heptulosonate 7-phosphate synthase [Cupriavidus respiraculi]
MSALLARTLRLAARRYRVPAIVDASLGLPQANPATALAVVIEQARMTMARRESPPAALKDLFLEALARMIGDAMRAESGDPAFRAMVLRHRTSHVREYASLSAHATQDRRQVLAAVNAMAHPNRRQRIEPGPPSEDMARLHAAATSLSWDTLHDTARRLLAMPDMAADMAARQGLARLLDSDALAHLRRLDALASDPLVRQYQALWDRHGPRPGSATATAKGVASQRRGAAAEASAAEAVRVLARRLDEVEGTAASYRVVTSMRVPASLPASHDRAKTEWDVVLLRQAGMTEGTPLWDACLLVEVKASVDAATSDLPRLLRGLRLLGHAEADSDYPFDTAQGTVRLRGASLRALTTEDANLADTVLYCCEAEAEAAPRLLGAASRMQLLSAPESLAFAGALADGQPAQPASLEPVWQQLLQSPRWAAVLNQYPMLRQVRELMVHPDDLLAAMARAG